MPWQWPWTRHDRDLFNIGDIPTSTTYAGVNVTPDQALKHSAVWACTRLLGDTVSTLPVDVYRRGERNPLPELPPLLRQPAAGMTLNDWLYAVMAALLLRGNCYGQIVDRAGAGLLPAQVELLADERVGVQANGRVIWRIDGQEVDPASIWHVKAYTAPGQLLGLSPVAYAKQTIGVGLAAERYGARWFGDQAIPSGVLTSDQRLGQEAADGLKARWKQAHQGRREIAVLGSGARFQPVSISPEESQFLGTLDAGVNAIARIYGIPPEMIGGTTAGHEAYSSPEMRSLDLLTWTIRPWLVRLENAISALLPATQRARFNAGGMVRASLRDRYEAHKVAIEAGFLTVNEVRELEDRGPLPEGGPGEPVA
jgi:HK97 family phage portal protein